MNACRSSVERSDFEQKRSTYSLNMGATSKHREASAWEPKADQKEPPQLGERLERRRPVEHVDEPIHLHAEVHAEDVAEHTRTRRPRPPTVRVGHQIELGTGDEQPQQNEIGPAAEDLDDLEP